MHLVKDGQEQISAKPPLRLKNAEIRPREYLTVAEVKQLRDAARRSRNGARDALLVLMLFRHGLRVSEAIELSWSDVNFDEGTLHCRRIKGGIDSRHFMEGDEIRQLRILLRSNASRFVFCSERGGPLSTRTAHHIIAKAGRDAGLPFSVHPHMLRHAKGFQLAQQGVDTRAIQGYLGHRSINSTVIYTALDPKRFEGFGKDL